MHIAFFFKRKIKWIKRACLKWNTETYCFGYDRSVEGLVLYLKSKWRTELVQRCDCASFRFSCSYCSLAFDAIFAGSYSFIVYLLWNIVNFDFSFELGDKWCSFAHRPMIAVWKVLQFIISMRQKPILFLECISST